MAIIIPIAILQIYCSYRLIAIEQFFGANLEKCFNIGKSLKSIEVIYDQMPERRNKKMILIIIIIKKSQGLII